MTFRLDFNNYHATQQAHGGKVGLTSTPPVIAKGDSRSNYYHPHLHNGIDEDDRSGSSSYNRMYVVNAFDISPTRVLKK